MKRRSFFATLIAPVLTVMGIGKARVDLASRPFHLGLPYGVFDLGPPPLYRLSSKELTVQTDGPIRQIIEEQRNCNRWSSAKIETIALAPE